MEVPTKMLFYRYDYWNSTKKTHIYIYIQDRERKRMESKNLKQFVENFFLKKKKK